MGKPFYAPKTKKMDVLVSIKLRRSPKPGKKWRVSFPDGKHIDFGQSGASDFTKHKEPLRMLRYLTRHAGLIPFDTKKQTRITAEDIVERALKVTQSHREKWDDIYTAGFWSRWLLWSHPSLEDAKKFISKEFDIRFE